MGDEDIFCAGDETETFFVQAMGDGNIFLCRRLETETFSVQAIQFRLKHHFQPKILVHEIYEQFSELKKS